MLDFGILCHVVLLYVFACLQRRLTSKNKNYPSVHFWMVLGVSRLSLGFWGRRGSWSWGLNKIKLPQCEFYAGSSNLMVQNYGVLAPILISCLVFRLSQWCSICVQIVLCTFFQDPFSLCHAILCNEGWIRSSKKEYLCLLTKEFIYK